MHSCLFLIAVAIILIIVNLMLQTHNIFCEVEEEIRSVGVKRNPEETKKKITKYLQRHQAICIKHNLSKHLCYFSNQMHTFF